MCPGRVRGRGWTLSFATSFIFVLSLLCGQVASPAQQPTSPTLVYTGSALYDFEDGAQDWEFNTVPAYFDEAVGSAGNGALSISPDAEETPFGQFGFWESPLMQIDAEEANGERQAPSIFMADWRFFAEGSQAEKQVVRVRSTREDYSMASILVITSMGDGDLSPGLDASDAPTTPTYTQFFLQPDGNETFRFSYDMLAFDDADGTDPIFLDDFQVENISDVLITTPTQVVSLSLANEAQGFTSRTAENIAAAQFAVTPLGLEIRGTEPVLARQGSPVDTPPAIFGYWGLETAVPFSGLALYQIQWTVASDATDEQIDDVPAFRLRVNDSSLQMAQYLNVESTGDAPMVPYAGNPVTYTQWVWAPAGIEGNTWIFSFDYIWSDESGNDSSIALTLTELRVAEFGILPDPGTVTGQVRNGLTNAVLEGVSVRFRNAEGEIIGTTITNGNGQYTITLPEGPFSAEFTLEGYTSSTLFDDVVAYETTVLDTVLLIPATGGQGDVSGRVISAVDLSAIAGATVNLRVGVGATDGTIVASTTADDSGNFSFMGLDEGVYTAEGHAPGFNRGFRVVICVGGEQRPNQDITLSPVLGEGQFRIVLTWGQTPSDLDSHLTGPDPNGGRFHLYYSTRPSDGLPDYINLDTDDTSSFGPETTTIYQRISGAYRFSVHNYTGGSTTFAESNALVTVYSGDSVVATFTVPANTENRVWNVFELDGDTGAITPLNTFDEAYKNLPAK